MKVRSAALAWQCVGDQRLRMPFPGVNPGRTLFPMEEECTRPMGSCSVESEAEGDWLAGSRMALGPVLVRRKVR